MGFPIAKVFREPARAAMYLWFYLHSWATMLRHGRRYMRFTGTLPARPYAIWKICRLLGITPSPDRGRPAFHHVDRTWCAPSPVSAINGRCCDIAKTTVARTFEQVFGYPLRIADPRSHAGPMVAKSERNSRNDGVLLDGPLARPRAGLCYQRAIDTRTEGNEIVDLRTMVVGDEIVQVALKYRKATPEARFRACSAERNVLRAAEAVFSPGERRDILEVCCRIGLDFGELDVLRDRADGRIYIVDINDTPCAPSEAMPLLQKIALMRRLAASFERQFCPRAAGVRQHRPTGWNRWSGAGR